MAIPSGLSSQIGYATETTYGTYQTVTRFVPLVSEDLGNEIARLQSEGIIAGARVLRSEQWSPGAVTIAGGVQHELYQQGLGVLFEHMFGSRSSSATGGVATHTFTPGTLSSKGMSTQVGRPDVVGTAYPFTYTGVKVSEWEIGLKAGEIATLGLSLIGQVESLTRSLETASYGTGAAAPFTFIDGSVSISGTATCVREITLTGNNGLADDRRCIGQANIDEPLEQALREYAGTATIEFNTTREYQRFLQGGEYPMVLSLSESASARLSITMNTRWDGKTPMVGGKELLVVEYPFVCVGTTAGGDGGAITAVMTNSQTSA